MCRYVCINTGVQTNAHLLFKNIDEAHFEPPVIEQKASLACFVNMASPERVQALFYFCFLKDNTKHCLPE